MKTSEIRTFTYISFTHFHEMIVHNDTAIRPTKISWYSRGLDYKNCISQVPSMSLQSYEIAHLFSNSIHGKWLWLKMQFETAGCRIALIPCRCYIVTRYEWIIETALSELLATVVQYLHYKHTLFEFTGKGRFFKRVHVYSIRYYHTCGVDNDAIGMTLQTQTTEIGSPLGTVNLFLYCSLHAIRVLNDIMWRHIRFSGARERTWLIQLNFPM